VKTYRDIENPDEASIMTNVYLEIYSYRLFISWLMNKVLGLTSTMYLIANGHPYHRFTMQE